jgi:hypothetical protein
VFVGTAGDFVFVVVGFGLRVLDEMFVLVPLPSPPPEVTSVATGPPGKVYGALGSKTCKSQSDGSMDSQE